MLTYAFDLLYAIYEEQGYQATDIPRLILTHNLYGIEIDQRAGALAAFALTMKAREKDRRFFSRKRRSGQWSVVSDQKSEEELATRHSPLITQPNICVLENVVFDDVEEVVSDEWLVVSDDAERAALIHDLTAFGETDNFGSLIRPQLTTEQIAKFHEQTTRHSPLTTDHSLLQQRSHQKVLKALRQADYLSPKYHVVVANPPYLSRKGMNAPLCEFGKSNFGDVDSDVFTMFMVRNLEMLRRGGFAGFMTPFVWMFTRTHSKLRKFILDDKSIQSLVHPEYHSFFDSAFVPICAFVIGNQPSEVAGQYFDLREFYGAELQPIKFREALLNTDCCYRHTASTGQLKKIPLSPIAYWASDQMRDAFRGQMLSDVFSLKEGLGTRDDDIFLRRFWEVNARDIRPTKQDENKWVKTDKAGGFWKWCTNGTYVMNWENDGYAIKNHRNPDGSLKSRPQNTQFFFRESVSWGKIGSGASSFRFRADDWAFNDAAPSMFGPNLYYVLGLLNSHVFNSLIELMGATLNLMTGIIGSLPYITSANKSEVEENTKQLIALTKADWDSQELSIDFQSLPLVNSPERSLAVAINQQRKAGRTLCEKIAHLEKQNNSFFIDAYSLHGELSPSVGVAAVTLTQNPYHRYDDDKSEEELEALLLADTMREFIGYAVGCIFGRYSLDKPGLILANQGETAHDYFGLTISGFGLKGEYRPSRFDECLEACSFAPDFDNVIPLLDGDWFPDDISERFKKFLRVTFGDDNYEENLTFLENALYPDNLTGKKRKTIRDYFLKEFYNHHIKLYKKRPIYWLFSSPRGTFNALIYMHRYRPDTVSVVLQYLRDFRDKLTHHSEHLQSIADSGTSSQSDKTRALKKITKLRKDLKELEEYERDELFPLAQQQIEIDLDDGVKVNYNKFGKALKKVTGLTK